MLDDLDDACCSDRPHWGHHMERRLTSLLHQILNQGAQIMSDQSHLDTDVQALTDGLTAVESEIAALKNQPGAPALDFTALDATVARLKSDAPAPSPAPEPTPSPAPTPGP